MRWVAVGVLAMLALASCEDNVTNVRLARDSIPAACRDTVVVVKRTPCVWRERVGWICLDAPLPPRPDDNDKEEESDA